ncbi:MAG: GreA/GreB family elongation factor [Herbinix sp.]|jgi:regulator of nucleoside diphosphate kinase|nr:GreA/GreB family elongation factor [Herbinix sp.]
MSQDIFITPEDKNRIITLIDKSEPDNRDTPYLKALEREVNRAMVISSEERSYRFITMNSKAILLVDGDPEEVSLVYPEDISLKDNKISVLSPMGTAILGLAEGSSIDWKIPNGMIHILVDKVITQEE